MGSAAADRRSQSGVCRRDGRRRGDFGMIDAAARAFGGAGATAMQRRKRGSPAGGRGDEAGTGLPAGGRWIRTIGANPARRPLQPEATGAGMEVTKCLKPTDSGHDFGDCASVQAATRVNAEQSSHDEGLVKGSSSIATPSPTAQTDPERPSRPRRWIAGSVGKRTYPDHDDRLH